MLKRRLISIPTLLATTILVTFVSPALLLIALLLSALPPYKGLFRTIAFALGYLWCETIGLTALFLVWVTKRSEQSFLDANRAIQNTWANALTQWGKTCFSIEFIVSGESALEGSPALVLPRHSSIAETVLPLVFYAQPQGIFLRYVMKQELLWDPCLDVAGNRLPNVFIDRQGQDSTQAVELISGLVAGLAPEEGLVCFPEGTRFTPEKRERLIGGGKDISEVARRWVDLLPPRLAGTLSILNANPKRDLVFMCHTGFEGAAHVPSLINGAWAHSVVKMHFWRVPYENIPVNSDAQQEFVLEQWDKMQEELDALNGPDMPASR